METLFWLHAECLPAEDQAAAACRQSSRAAGVLRLFEQLGTRSARRSNLYSNLLQSLLRGLCPILFLTPLEIRLR